MNETQIHADEAKTSPADELNNLRLQVEALSWPQHFDWQLVKAEPNPDRTAEAKPFAGITGVNPDLLTHLEASKFVVAHERIHLQFGMELRRPIIEQFPELNKYWLEHVKGLSLEEITQLHSVTYLEEKYWEGLYPAWRGPAGVTKVAAQQSLVNYFTVVNKGLIDPESVSSDYYYHPSTDTTTWQEKMSVPDKTLEELQDCYSDDLLGILATGYALGDYLHSAYREAESLRSGVDLWVVEEGFANFVASKVTGIAPESTNEWAPQDSSKLAMTQKFSAINDAQTEPIERTVIDYPSLAALIKQSQFAQG